MMKRSTGSVRRYGIGLSTGLLALAAAGVESARAGLNPFTEEALSRGLAYETGITIGQNGNGYFGFGSAIVDLDDDGDQDILIVGGADDQVGLFRNDGAGQFTDISVVSGMPILVEASGVAVGDFDGDGLLDVYLTSYHHPNLLMRNLGGLTFVEVGAAAGVNNPGPSKGASFGDYNGDGWLDLYLCNYGGTTSISRNKLYHNVGNGTFFELGAEQGVNSNRNTFQSVWTDFDLDGDLDLYLSNDNRSEPEMLPNELFRNDNGTFVDVTDSSGAGIALDSMGLASGDFDGNGWPDFFLTNIGGVGGMNNPLLLNQGDGTFLRFEVEAGVQGAGAGTIAWGAIFFDYENDGTQDLYVNYEFHANELFSCAGGFPCSNMAAFLDVDGPSGGSCVVDPCSFGSSIGDVDGDGDLDLLVNNTAENVRLYINHEGDTRNWIRYRVEGALPNRQAIGSYVNTRTGSQWQMREILSGGNSYTGINEFVVHVGLGAATQADEVLVRWPGGAPTRTLSNLPANRVWTIYRPDRLGDVDGDGQVDEADFPTFVACLGEPFEPGCEIMDFESDGDVDCADYDDMALAWTGAGVIPPLAACAGGVPAVSEWGMVIAILLTLLVATLIFCAQRRRLLDSSAAERC